jgi:CRISPR-associated protein Cmr5
MAKSNKAKKQTPEQKALKNRKHAEMQERKEQVPVFEKAAVQARPVESQRVVNSPSSVSTQNASQQRAAYALKSVNSMISELEPSAQKEFKSYVQGLPAMVQMNGLGQAIAFYRSHFTETDKSKKGAVAYAKLYAILSGWLCGDNPLAVYPLSDDLLDAIVSHDQYKYRLAQSELQSLLVWLKSMSVALIEVPEEGE